MVVLPVLPVVDVVVVVVEFAFWCCSSCGGCWEGDMGFDGGRECDGVDMWCMSGNGESGRGGESSGWGRR